MEGVTILTTEVVTTMHPILRILGLSSLLIAIVGSLLFLIELFFNNQLSSLGAASIITAVIICFGSSILGIFIKVPLYNVHEAIIEDTVSVVEFLNKYEIIEQREQIYVIKEIEE